MNRITRSSAGSGGEGRLPAITVVAWPGEEGYAEDVATFREEVNAVPSTFQALYDLTESSATGTH